LRTRIKRLLELDRSMRRKVRLTAIAESRHNSSLREIDRRRPVLGESVQKIEDGELK
jgi:hypothetical protein